MKKLFICGPFRAPTMEGIRANIEEAKKVAAYYWRTCDYNVYCPHLNSGAFHGLIDDEQFLKAAIQELVMSDCVVLVPGWAHSKGSVIERSIALSLDIEIWEHITSAGEGEQDASLLG